MNGTVIRPVLVAAGAVCALLAALAVFDQSWELAYAWLGFGLIADLAHRYVASSSQPNEPPRHPAFDGEGEHRARAAIVYLNTVFVPALGLIQAGFLEGTTGVMVATLIILSGMFRMASNDWARPVAVFEGFPAAWGVAGFALHAFDATPAAAALAIGAVLIVSLIRLRWPHPVYATRWAQPTQLVTLLAALTAASVLWHGFPAGVPAKSALIVFAVYAAVLATIGFLTVDQDQAVSHQQSALGFTYLEDVEPTERSVASKPGEQP